MSMFAQLHFRPSWSACILQSRRQHHGSRNQRAWGARKSLKTDVDFINAQRRAMQPAHAAPDGQASSTMSSEDEVDVERLVAKAVNLIATSNTLVPYDSNEVNLALVIWQAIREVPAQHRPQIMYRLTSGAVKRLWRVSGDRYRARPRQVAAAIGPEYSLWADLPDSPEQIVHFVGKAALLTQALGLGRFGAAFFLHPDSEALYARLAVGWGPLGDLLYPLYCRGSVGQEIVPGTEEVCDLALQFLPPETLGLEPDDVPRSLWPAPRAPLPPFNEGFTGYVRAAGPGVYVGKGVRRLAGPEEPLYFVLARQRAESLA